jgi:3-phenylpropionate/trans-cinnamate dioxygenase ferredoxin reductase component
MSANAGVVIAGGSLAAFTSAEALRAEGFAGRIQIFSGEDCLPYNRPPLSKQVLLGTWDASKCLITTPERIQDLNIEFHSGVKVTGLHSQEKKILVGDAVHNFDKLIIATGVRARKIDMSENIKKVITVRNLEDTLNLKEQLARVTNIGVIGSGVLGCEIASAISASGKKVTILDQISMPNLPMSGGHISEKIKELFVKNNVEMRLGVGVKEINEVGNKVEIQLNDGESIEVELLVLAIGSVNNTEWLVESGLDISNGVLCDSNGEAAADIFAVGDVARWLDKRSGAAIKRENQSSAIEQGLAVGKYIATGAESVISRSFFWSEIFGQRITLVGFLDPKLDFQILHGSLAGNSFVGATFADGSMTGLLGWNMSKEFRQERKKMEETVNV